MLGDAVVDISANVGTQTLAFAEFVGPTEKVLVFPFTMTVSSISIFQI